ncbi:MAG: fibrobacter succinogenes major paralogous domain-containing protein [Cyclobacteriaceae bacterium]|nr:fibrobacter succinogenes major paralogous domain-containing protein [Cyclobacteriaceae bacterium]
MFCTLALAQTPDGISFQAVIRDNNNELVSSRTVSIRISILQGSATGNAVYTENFNVQTNAQGLISLAIGSGNNFRSIDWSAGPYFIKSEADPAGAGNFNIIGTSQILSVPYALHAKTAEVVTGGMSEQDPVFSNSEASRISALDMVNLGNLSGINTGDQDLSQLATKEALADSAARIRSDFPDLNELVKEEKDPVFESWDRSEGIQISEKQILDLQAYLTEEKDPVFTATFDLSRAAAGDLMQFDGRRWVKFTPDYLTEYKETQNLSDVAALGNSVNSQIKNLTDPTDAQDAATKAYIDAVLRAYDIIPDNFTGLVSDIDGNQYRTVVIGNQTWMADNLRVTKFNDGTPIPLITNEQQWDEAAMSLSFFPDSETASPAYCWYENNEALGRSYGALYNINTLSPNTNQNKNICPQGWRVPSVADFQQLVNFIGGVQNGLNKIKERGLEYWEAPNESTNEFGFSARGAGIRLIGFNYLKRILYLMTSDDADGGVITTMGINSEINTILVGDTFTGSFGASIRCLSDE